MRNNGKGGMRTSGNNYSIWCPKCGKPAARMDITPNGNTYMHFTKKGVVYHSAPQKESARNIKKENKT
jgi:hypothetical protein